MMLRTYSELSRLKTFEERFEYLKLNGSVGKETFGFDRIFNQTFYLSYDWKRAKNKIIVRDEGLDLGSEGHDIVTKFFVHHMNPITLYDIEHRTDILLDPEYLILTSLDTHNAIHYGDANLLARAPIERTRNDTCPWRH